MVDDLLDFTAEEKTLGKPVANDLREGKVTLPMIFLLQRGGRAAEDKVKAVLEDRGLRARHARRPGAARARVRRARRGARHGRALRRRGARQPARPSSRRPTARRSRRCPASSSPATTDALRRAAAHDHAREGREADRPVAGGDPAPRAPLLRARRARDLRPGVRRARARAARARGRVPGARHARQPHPARGRDAVDGVSELRAPRADAEPRQHLLRGGAARVRGAHLPRGRPARDRLHRGAEDRRPVDGAALPGRPAGARR